MSGVRRGRRVIHVVTLLSCSCVLGVAWTLMASVGSPGPRPAAISTMSSPVAEEGAKVTVTRSVRAPRDSGTPRRTDSGGSQSGVDVPSNRATTTTATPSASAHEDVDCSVAACVALTFDDGPGRWTEQILDELDTAGVRATFFELGSNVATRPDVTRDVVRRGHVLGSHTYSHANLSKLSFAAQRAELEQASQAFTDAGVPVPKLVRPPYGAFNASSRALGVPLILWNVDSEDWKNRDAKATTDLVMSQVRRNSIVLLHDIHQSTAEAVPGIIDQLRATGYVLVTVPQLVGSAVPGSAYYHG